MLRNYPCNPQRFFSDGRRRRCIPLCCEGALLLTPCFLALSLAVLPLLLPDLLEFLPLLCLLPPLLLRSRAFFSRCCFWEASFLSSGFGPLSTPSSLWLVLHVRAVVVPSGGPVQPFFNRAVRPLGGPRAPGRTLGRLRPSVTPVSPRTRRAHPL